MEMFYLVNSQEDEANLLRACDDSGLEYTSYNLANDMTRLAWHFEKRVPRKKTDENSLLSTFLGVEDQEIKPKEHWYIGYNTLNYDIPMIDFLLNSSFAGKVQTTTASLRAYSDTLINRTARAVDTRSYERYANQVDAAFLNETMVDKGRPTIGLKTLVGVKGGSIVESESNKTGHSKDIHFDTLYNINDVMELKDVVYPEKMESTFEIRNALLSKYPKLSQNGVTMNSTSAKFVEYIVSPDGPIEDYPTVSFMYPAPHIAKKLGVEQKDVLEYFKDWYTENVYKKVVVNNPKAANNHLAKFMSVYSYYAAMRGKNWNDSTSHILKHGIPAVPKSERRTLLDQYGVYTPFMDKYGNDSGTYANFSSGGIHGSEVFVKQLEQDRAKIAELKDKYKFISMIPKKEVSKKLLNLIIKQSRSRYKGYPQHLSHEIPEFYKQTTEVDEILDPEEFTPYMYDPKKKAESLIERYKYTSTGMSVHQDFAGYYPMCATRLLLKR